MISEDMRTAGAAREEAASDKMKLAVQPVQAVVSELEEMASQLDAALASLGEHLAVVRAPHELPLLQAQREAGPEQAQPLDVSALGVRVGHTCDRLRAQLQYVQALDATVAL